MHYYGAVQLLLETLLDQDEHTLHLRLPQTFPLFNSKGIYDPAAILKWFSEEAASLAAQFDARNGNGYYVRWFAGMKNLKALAISVPLGVDEDY